MNNYYKHVVTQKKIDYTNLIVPILKKLGYKEQEVCSLFNNNQVRTRWGKDWNEFTIHMTNPLNEPTWIMDDLIHAIWRRVNILNRLIVTCFIRNKGIGPVVSLAITDLYALANGLKNYGIFQNNKNRFNRQTFLTLPFGHPSLSKNISGMGIKTISV